MKIISIDPSMNGVTGIIVAEWDPEIDITDLEKETITLTNFANVDFRGLDEEGEKITDPTLLKEVRYQQLEKVLDFIEKQQPDLVILENFIMFKVQMGAFGQSFITSEMIGVIDLHCRRLKIPVIKPRSSDVRSNKQTYTSGGNPKPRKFKDNLTNKALKERGFLVAKRYNRTHLVVGGNEYCLADYQIGSKNDHIIMALRHLINILESSKIPVEEKIQRIKHSWEATENNDND